MNLGTPEAPSKSAVKAFLKEFLSDHRVVEIPRLVWLPILYGIILPFRPRRVVDGYRQIWTQEGSPLEVITRRQASALAETLSAGRCASESNEAGSVSCVTYAMTYGKPTLKQRVAELSGAGVDRILVLPLYPQYSATTTAAVYDQYASLILNSRNIPDIVIHKHYYERADYIDALADSIQQFWQRSGRSERLLLSFHGIPQRCVDLGDPYYDQCRLTSFALIERLGLNPDQWAFSFQSRLGSARWLQPYTDQILLEWAKSGVNSVDVICPAFSADCLETIEEIDAENKQRFLEAGGKSFNFIPCLNDSEKHILMMANLVKEYTE